MDILKKYIMCRVNTKIHPYIILYLIVILFGMPLFADVDVNIFSPGKLSKYHKDLEGSSNCSQCHVKQGEAVIQKKSCFICHDALEKRIKNKKGYHYQVITKEKKNCEECHKEHFGDRYKLVTWPDKKSYKKFNHDLTGYKLKGVHKKAECEDCHKKEFIKDKALFKDENVNIKRTYLGLSTACVSCHPNDFHKEQITDENCENCHNQDDFKDARLDFDHEQTKFTLKGEHGNIGCENCHKPLTKVFYQEKWRDQLEYKDLKHENCVDCHKKDDIHEEKFGKTCESCHTETSFNEIIYDIKTHAVDTFPIEGKHKEENCQSCHTKKLNEIPKSTTCVSCHKKDDPHKMKFGETCESCHTDKGFDIIDDNKFDHDLTKYILEGAHKKLSCEKCHSPVGSYKKRYIVYNKEKGCVDCHKQDDVHNGEFDEQNCSECHNQSRFLPSEFTIEKHNETEFKLDGSHEMVSCNQCHKPYNKGEKGFIIPKERKKGFAHSKTLTFHTEDKNCENCHNNPHIDQFEEITHPKEAKHLASSPLHLSDSQKEGSISEIKNKKINCEKCHTTESFHKVLFDHNKDTKFKLINSHKDASCQRCHEYKKDEKHEFKGYYLYTKNNDKDCSYCHTDIHQGQFEDKKCADCHTDVKWEDLSLFDHNRDTKFILDGKHTEIDCEDCHKPVKLKDVERINYKIKNYSCIDCHDPYHRD